MGLFPWRHYSHQSSRRRRPIVAGSAFVVRRPACKPPPTAPLSLPYRTTRRRTSRTTSCTRHTAFWFKIVLKLPTLLTHPSPTVPKYLQLFGHQISQSPARCLMRSISPPAIVMYVKSRGQDAWRTYWGAGDRRPVAGGTSPAHRRANRRKNDNTPTRVPIASRTPYLNGNANCYR